MKTALPLVHKHTPLIECVHIEERDVLIEDLELHLNTNTLTLLPQLTQRDKFREFTLLNGGKREEGGDDNSMEARRVGGWRAW